MASPIPKLKDFLRFGVVGIIGFLVNLAGLSLFLLYVPPIPAQFLAFPPAVVTTWWLNRRFTFKSRNPWRTEALRYLLVNCMGWLVLNGTYSMLVLWFKAFQTYPGLALAVGSVAGMSFNFLLSYAYVFRNSH